QAFAPGLFSVHRFLQRSGCKVTKYVELICRTQPEGLMEGKRTEPGQLERRLLNQKRITSAKRLAGLLSCVWQHMRRVRTNGHIIGCRCTKQYQRPRLSDGGEVIPIRGEIQRPEFLGDARLAAGETPENRQFAAKGSTPKPDGVIAATTSQGLAIGRKRQSP